jgi:hypothetical protein
MGYDKKPCEGGAAGEKMEYIETVHHLFTDFKEACHSVRREVLYNILIEFGVPIIQICLKNTVKSVKHLSDSFPIQNGLKQGDALSPVLFNIAAGYAIRKVQKNQVGHVNYWYKLMM